MCLVHTALNVFLKLGLNSLRSMQLMRNSTRERIESYIDGSSMFLSFKIYNLLLCIILFFMMQTRGTPTFMKRQSPYKVGTYGGIPEIELFWESELMCDLVSLLLRLGASGQLVGILLMLTRFRKVTHRRIMHLLRKRFFFVGWDGLMAAQLLGMDPTRRDFLVNGQVRAKCSLGTLLQLLYQSGPSSFVHLSGDYIFSGTGFSDEPKKFHFPIERAVVMGLFDRGNGSVYLTGGPSTNLTENDSVAGKSTIQATTVSLQTLPNDELSATDDVKSTLDPSQSVRSTGRRSTFERELMIVSDGYLGKILLVDEAAMGSLATNQDTGIPEYVVGDALATISILDIKWLFGNKKKLLIG